MRNKGKCKANIPMSMKYEGSADTNGQLDSGRVNGKAVTHGTFLKVLFLLCIL